FVVLVEDRVRDREVTGGEVCGGRGCGVEGVVAGIGTRDRDPGDAHGLAGPHVLVAERGRGVAVGEGVTGHPVVRQGHGGGGVAVDRKSVVQGRDGEGRGRDVGCGRGG